MHHIEHFINMSPRVVNENEEIVVEPVLEEGQPPVEVGFDICGTDLEPDYPAD
jgi:hypothetical protein